MTPEERQQLNDLIAWKRSFDSASTISLKNDQALRGRLQSLSGQITTSSKGATSEDVTIDTTVPGSSTVLNNPDLFLQVTINSTVYYIPVFT